MYQATSKLRGGCLVDVKLTLSTQSLSTQSVAKDAAITHPIIINSVACSFSTSNITCKRLVAEILTYMCYFENGLAHRNVLAAIDALSSANNQTGRYDYWFKSFMSILEGRGRMGSLVGASENVKKHGGQDTALNDYAVRLHHVL